MNALVPGRASPNSTHRFAERMADRTAPDHYRDFDGRRLSSIGLGTYLGENDARTDELYRRAVLLCIERGLNVIDTAIVYRAERSERAIGSALRTAIERKLCERDEMFVCTKGGLLPGSESPSRERRDEIEAEYVRTGLFSWDELVRGRHCLAPRFISHQVDRSRDNLRLETIDVYLVHNPELQLTEVPRAEFLRRLRFAFEVLEIACAEGRIAAYGAATWNGLRIHPRATQYLSVDELVETAREVGGPDHRFKYLELPVNVAAPEAFRYLNQRAAGAPCTTLDAARHHGLYVLASAAIAQARLGSEQSSLVSAIRGLDTDAQRALQLARSTPGVGTALVGMKRPEHVEENTRLARLPLEEEHVVREILGAIPARSLLSEVRRWIGAAVRRARLGSS